MTREILTLQIGNQSNYVGVHFWNQLEHEFNQKNSSIDFHSYLTFNQKTNLPTARVLICDYRNTFGHLLDENPMKFEANPSIEIINRLKSDNSWSKYLKTRTKFNEKSLLPLRDYWHNDENQNNQFDIYPIGQEVFKTNIDQFEHSIHFLLESCDSLQSFRCLYDVNNSFSGLFSSIQDYLHDECPKQPIWSFAIGENSSSSIYNLAFSLVNSINENHMPTLACLDNPDAFETSLAIQHALYSSLFPLDVLADRLCPMKRSFLKLFSKIPFDYAPSKTLMNYLDKTDLFPSLNPSAMHFVVRGLTKAQLYNSSVSKFDFETAGELIERYLREEYNSHMFISNTSWTEKYDGINVLSAMINDEKSSEEFFGQLIEKLKKSNLKTISKRWQENNFDEQMFEQLINDLSVLHEQYLF